VRVSQQLTRSIMYASVVSHFGMQWRSALTSTTPAARGAYSGESTIFSRPNQQMMLRIRQCSHTKIEGSGEADVRAVSHHRPAERERIDTHSDAARMGGIDSLLQQHHVCECEVLGVTACSRCRLLQYANEVVGDIGRHSRYLKSVAKQRERPVKRSVSAPYIAGCISSHTNSIICAFASP
jgi:hypothetical protein